MMNRFPGCFYKRHVCQRVEKIKPHENSLLLPLEVSRDPMARLMLPYCFQVKDSVAYCTPNTKSFVGFFILETTYSIFECVLQSI